MLELGLCIQGMKRDKKRSEGKENKVEWFFPWCTRLPLRMDCTGSRPLDYKDNYGHLRKNNAFNMERL